MPERAIPAGIERGQRRQQDVAQIGERGIDLVGHIEPLAAQRSGLPEQSDLADDRVLHQFAILGLQGAQILDPHQIGDAVTVVDHALAAHFGGVRGQHRHDQRMVEQPQRLRAVDALLGEPIERLRHVGIALGGRPLPVFGEVGEHREQHEAAHEGERVVEGERVETGVDRVRSRDAARAIDRDRADIFYAAEQRVAAIGADHVPQQLAEKADVGILRDGEVGGHSDVLQRSRSRVNRSLRCSSSLLPYPYTDQASRGTSQ